MCATISQSRYYAGRSHRLSEAFEAYVEHFLALSLFVRGKWWCSMGWGHIERRRSGSSSKREGSADLLFLLSYYSPDLNPIERTPSARSQGARVC
jgi:hypothetical protein